MTTRLTNLPVPFTFQFNVTTAGTPEKLTAKLRAATIGFTEGSASPDTITDSASGFLAAGFQPGDQVTVAGSASNDGTYTIKTVTAGTITLESRNDLATEAAGATVKLTAPKIVPDGVSCTVKAKNANTGIMHFGHSSESALNTAGGSFTLDNNESFGFQIDTTDRLWVDATVSGEGVEVAFEANLRS